MTQDLKRKDGRAADELRPVSFELDIAPAALSSVLISVGDTRVICAVSVDESVPPWMRYQKVPGGWLTAEYSLLPYSTADRNKREGPGRTSGRTMEIQRLIGRSLRAAVDLQKIGERTLVLDCDVLQADGGTRTASVTGGFLALRLAFDKLHAAGKLKDNPLIQELAAVSVGVVDGVPVLDLPYEEDVRAGTDMNVVMTAAGEFIEVQGTAEERPFDRAQLDGMLDLATKGIAELMALQKQVAQK